MAIRQEPALPARPSFGSRSGIAGTSPQGPGHRAHRSPSAETCGRQRREAWPPRVATCQASRLRNCIRSASRLEAFFFGPEPGICHRHQRAFVGISRNLEQRLHIGVVFLDFVRFHCGAVIFAARIGVEANANAATPFCADRVRVGHLSLHQRAPLPFQWLEYRAIGPTCQPPIFGPK